MRTFSRPSVVSLPSYAAWTAAFALAWCIAPGLVPKARACGGFWCSQQAPVNQSAERILFVDHEDGTVSALIEIRYNGPSERFAWLIPVPGNPDIAIASGTAIERLDIATAPNYQLQRTVEGTCKEDPNAHGASVDAGAYSEDEDGGPSASPVMVVDSGTVGPYDYATIAVAPDLDDPASAALNWFRNNGYDFSSLDGDVLRPYLKEGLHLLAFKLTKSSQTQVGAIRPVIIHYPGELPMIPIRPTAVAAEEDMGVLVWIAGESRAVPSNYKSLVLDEALIDWFDSSSNYDEVVTHAADEAGGQGFVTELAGRSIGVAKSVFSDSEDASLRGLETASYPDGLDALWAANNLFREWDGWRDAVAAAVTLPDGVTLDEFARDPESFRTLAQVSTDALFSALHEKVVDPVIAVRRLLESRRYLTRLYTTMSPAEMTMDPSFAFNADLPDLGNVHIARQIIACSPSVTESDAPWQIELPQGDVVRGTGYEWPFAIDALPANRRVEQLAPQGQPKVLEDNSAVISAALSKAERLPATGGPRGSAGSGAGKSHDEPQPTDDDASASSDSGCAVRAAGTNGRSRGLPYAPLAIALFALAALARSRRRA